MPEADKVLAERLALRRRLAVQHLIWSLAYARHRGWDGEQVARWVYDCQERAGWYQRRLQRGPSRAASLLSLHVRVREVLCPGVSIRVGPDGVRVRGSPLLAGHEAELRALQLPAAEVHRFVGAHLALVGDAFGVPARWEVGPGEEAAWFGGAGEVEVAGWRPTALASLAHTAMRYVPFGLALGLGAAVALGMTPEDMGRWVAAQHDRAGVLADLVQRVRQDPQDLVRTLAADRLAVADAVEVRQSAGTWSIESRSFVPLIPHVLAALDVGPEDFGRFWNGYAELLSDRTGALVIHEVGHALYRTTVRVR